MSRLHEPLQQHIHDDLCSEVNDMIIKVKLHQSVTLVGQSDEQRAKILEARKRHPEPTWTEIIELLSRVRDEMNDCKIPFKRY
jgi:hypothetical protein